MSTRTLLSWRYAALGEPARPPGRPPRTAWAWRAIVRQVEAALEACGVVGWRTVYAWLAGQVSTDAVQRALAWWKRRWRARRRKAAVARALRVAVLTPGLVWSVDGTHVGRDGRGRALETQGLKDNGSRLLIGADLGHAVTGEDVVALLEAARAQEGELPLALLSDNGPPYTSEVVRAYTRAARKELYAAARRAMHEARQGEGTDRARRLAERRAALALLEQHGIITITRGSDDQGGVKSEEVS